MGSVKRHTSGRERLIVTSLRLFDHEHAALKRIAALDKRSLSNELRFLIEQRVAEIQEGES